MVIFNGNQITIMKAKQKSLFPSSARLGDPVLSNLYEAIGKYLDTSSHLRAMEERYHKAGLEGNVDDIFHVIDHQHDVRDLYATVAQELAQANYAINSGCDELDLPDVKRNAEWTYDEALKLNTPKK
jgi:hypothetical protein